MVSDKSIDIVDLNTNLFTYIVDPIDRYFIDPKMFLELNKESDPQALNRDICLIFMLLYQSLPKHIHIPLPWA